MRSNNNFFFVLFVADFVLFVFRPIRVFALVGDLPHMNVPMPRRQDAESGRDTPLLVTRQFLRKDSSLQRIDQIHTSVEPNP